MQKTPVKVQLPKALKRKVAFTLGMNPKHDDVSMVAKRLDVKVSTIRYWIQIYVMQPEVPMPNPLETNQNNQSGQLMIEKSVESGKSSQQSVQIVTQDNNEQSQVSDDSGPLARDQHYVMLAETIKDSFKMVIEALHHRNLNNPF